MLSAIGRRVTAPRVGLLLLPRLRSARGALAAASTSTSDDSQPHAASSSQFTVEDVAGWMHEARAEDVLALDVSHLLGGAVGEAFVFGTGRSRPHMLRIAKTVKSELKHRGARVFDRTPGIEGSHADDWLLIDGGSVVVSVMVHAARERLALERHWEEQGATRLELPDEPTARVRPGGLPGETHSPGEIPAPPAHWGDAVAAADVDTPLEEVYRESAKDDLLVDGDGDGEDEYYYDEYGEEGYEEYELSDDEYDADSYDDYSDEYDAVDEEEPRRRSVRPPQNE